MQETIETQGLEVEQIVLGMLLQDTRYLDAWHLSASDFAEPLHIEMFEKIEAAHARGEPHNVTTMAAVLHNVEPIRNDLTVPEYVRGIFTKSIREAVPGIHKMLKDFANRRRAQAIGQQLIWASSEQQHPISEAFTDAVAQIDTALSATRERRTKAQLGKAMVQSLEAMRSDNGTSRLPIGLNSLQRVLGGWHRGQFIIIAGRPGMGKSMLVQSMMLRSAQSAAGVMMFSLEMTTDELAKRGMSDLSYTNSDPIPYQAAANGLSDRHFDRWSKAAAKYETLPFMVDDQRNLTVAEIAARARQQKNEWEAMGGSLDIVVVDHLGLIKPSDRYRSNKVQEIGEISNGLATLAKDLDVAVVALSQLNRATEGRDNKRPTLADLRNSGDLEQDAHVVAFAYREAYYLERMQYDAGSQQEMDRQARLEATRNTMEFLIAKNRNGPTDMVPLFCDPACNVVRDIRYAS
jgi:replicative DNA helicase